MFYIAESDGKVHGTHSKLKKHTQIIFIYFFIFILLRRTY